DEDHVKSWEIRHGTHKDYAKHLCLIFGLPASELGLLSDEELALRPCALPVPSGLSGMVDCRQSVQGRREVMAMTSSKPNLQWALALRAAGVPLDADQEEVLVGSRRQPVVSRTDPRAVESYTAIVGHQRALYWTTPPGTLLGAASAHLGLGVDMLQDDPADNPALASAVAECALL